MMKFVEDDTDPIEFDLLRAPTVGATPATFNAAGLTPSMVIKAKDKVTLVVTAGKVEWADQANSRVRFNRAAGDLLKSKSPYYVHVTLIDGLNIEASWPEGSGEEWVIKGRAQP